MFLSEDIRANYATMWSSNHPNIGSLGILRFRGGILKFSSLIFKLGSLRKYMAKSGRVTLRSVTFEGGVQREKHRSKI